VKKSALASVIIVIFLVSAFKVSAGEVMPASLEWRTTLPYLRDLTICRELSSHDRKGGNDNGFTNKAEQVKRLYGNKVVLMDAAGPGAVMSLWYSWFNHPAYYFLEPIWSYGLGKARFFFEGQSKARFKTPLRRLVGAGPFTHPLAIHADDSTGGYVSYVPMPYRESLKAVLDGGGMPNFFYHIWYHTYPLGTEVESWRPSLEIDPPREWDLEQARAPLSARSGKGLRVIEKGPFSVGPGEEVRLMEWNAAGVIESIRMALPQDDEALKNLVLRAYWDGEEKPSVSAPLSLLFAIENRFEDDPRVKVQAADMKGIVIGKDRSGLYYFNLPMPFNHSARLCLFNSSHSAARLGRFAAAVRGGRLGEPGRTTGYLSTEFRQSRRLPRGRDYLMADLSGRGLIVGAVLAADDIPENFLEGDERIYTDGGRSPLIMGDATETYFNGSWYFFGRAFSCPVHGAPVFNRHEETNKVAITMYRFHLTDFVPYRGGARFFIQHGAFNNVYGSYRSLVFYYGADEPSLAATDCLDLSDHASLVSHSFAARGPVTTKERDGFFEGVYNGQHLGFLERPEKVSPAVWMVRLTVKGVLEGPPQDSPDRRTFKVSYHHDAIEFDADVDPSARAVMLRRLFDQSVKDQRAIVYVDGEKAGTWCNAGGNRWKIWMEDDLILKPRLTRGKDKVRIRIEPQGRFSAASYQVFAIKEPLGPTR